MPLRRTVRKLSSNLSIDTPIFVAIAGLHRIVDANRAIAMRFMFPSSLAAPGRAFSLPVALNGRRPRFLWRARYTERPRAGHGPNDWDLPKWERRGPGGASTEERREKVATIAEMTMPP